MNQITQIKKNINNSLVLPLYHQVYLILKENIQTGVYSQDSPLPAEYALCKEFNVSRITVKRAMKELVADGLISRARGKGTFIAEKPSKSFSNHSIDDLLESVEAIDDKTQVRHLVSEIISPPKHVAYKLNLEIKQTVLFSRQLRISKNEPLAIISAYVPEHIGIKLNKEFKNKPMLLQLNKAGISPFRAEQTVTATIADPETALLLHTEVGAPILNLSRLIFDNSQQPVEWLNALYRADRHVIRTSLKNQEIFNINK